MGGTAALESALTGTPTLIYDLNNWKASKLYELGEGKVIFKKLEHLWDSISDQFSSKNINSELGNWEPVINDLDPFRDGKAYIRVANYLNKLIDGFKKGINRDTILANAAEQYSEKWGADKIKSVNYY